MLRRLTALVGILLMLCTLASLIWVVYLHRVHATTTEPDDTVEVISQLSVPNAEFRMQKAEVRCVQHSAFSILHSHIYMEESLNV